MNYSKEYTNLAILIRNCSDHLDKKFGFVLSGSPELITNIKEHYRREPDDHHTIYGLSLTVAFEKINICISSDKDRFQLFLEENR